ncbi:unnamed protein product [Phytophthora lilii]|uniref:Ribonuclease n=1 Tax=Phytophthora lilii TaxID=2077276 RepID=A0A9W6THJ0_9STRA|nr:unnamed protein product [Phytophthora lilii]
MLGIDEAGRGPVMGPMVYGAAYWPVADNDAMSALGFDDSKALSAESRGQLFEKMRSTEGLGKIHSADIGPCSQDQGVVDEPLGQRVRVPQHHPIQLGHGRAVLRESCQGRVAPRQGARQGVYRSMPMPFSCKRLTDFVAGCQANAPAGTQSITSFLAKPAKKASPAPTRAAFFTQRRMHDVTDFAQYGGWLRIKLLLFSHALVVDPDADTGTPRRKRRGSLKLWMDLCLVKDIESVQKEDDTAAVRRGSYSASQAAAQSDARFRFSVQTQQITLQFATATTEQRDEWLHCLLLATKLRAKHEMQELQSDRDADARIVSWSASYSVSTIVPVSEASQENVSAHQVKQDAIKQLQAELRRPLHSDKTSRPGIFQNILEREADTFILYLDIGDQWLKDEKQSIGHYILGCASRRIQLALVPMNKMPEPTIDLAIVDTKTKVSDLSQRSFTCYLIDVYFNGTTWQLARRYKEFHVLHSHLKTKYPAIELPGLPPKHVFTPVEGEFINYRKEQLESFLKQLLLHPIASTDVLLLSFLGVVSVSRDPELGQRDKSVIHVTSLHDSISCGDIILFSCRFGASRLQRKVRRPALMAGIATSEGIQVYSLKARLMAYSREVSNSIVVRKVETERTPELVELLREFVLRVNGNPYSIFGILRSSGESERNIFNSIRGTNSGCEEADDAFASTGSSTSSTPSSPVTDTDATKSKRKYFCSSLVASAWKELGWLQTKRKSSSFWPGSFEDGGEVEGLLAPGVALGAETVIDCRIVEVGLAAQC